MDWFNSQAVTTGGKTTPLRVSEVSAIIETLLDDERLQEIWVKGEITNYTHHSRGHRYFSLSEKGGTNTAAVIKCVMWRSAAERLSFTPDDGMEVIVAGSIRHYAPHGVYQLQIEEMQTAGLGEKYLLVEKWRQELAEEGYFASGRKRPLPPFPKKVGIVTSETGAVIHDILNVISRRYPLEIVISPTAVQGEGVHAEITRAILRLSGEADVVIIARGGGSFEDLFPFNHPDVIRAIGSCPVPVVAAIGHEVDVTLADLAADVRAPTPSAAAELVVPDRLVLHDWLRNLKRRLAVLENNRIEQACQTAGDLRDRLRPQRFIRKIGERKQRTADLAERLERGTCTRIEREYQILSELKTAIDATSPLRILARGYCVAEKEGKLVRRVGQVARDDHLSLRFHDGKSRVIVERVEYDRDV